MDSGPCGIHSTCERKMLALIFRSYLGEGVLIIAENSFQIRTQDVEGSARSSSARRPTKTPSAIFTVHFNKTAHAIWSRALPL